MINTTLKLKNNEEYKVLYNLTPIEAKPVKLLQCLFSTEKGKNRKIHKTGLILCQYKYKFKEMIAQMI